MAVPGTRRRVRLFIEWLVEAVFRPGSAEWIPPRPPRLSLARPDAVEVSLKEPA